MLPVCNQYGVITLRNVSRFDVLDRSLPLVFCLCLPRNRARARTRAIEGRNTEYSSMEIHYTWILLLYSVNSSNLSAMSAFLHESKAMITWKILQILSQKKALAKVGIFSCGFKARWLRDQYLHTLRSTWLDAFQACWADLQKALSAYCHYADPGILVQKPQAILQVGDQFPLNEDHPQIKPHSFTHPVNLDHLK